MTDSTTPSFSTSGLAAPGVSRRSVIVGGAMALTSAAAYAATPRQVEHSLAHRKLGDTIARQIGRWTLGVPANVILPNDEVENSDGYDQVLSRVYIAEGLPTIMLCIAYGGSQSGNLRLHRPETCYPSQGFSLSGFQVGHFDFPGATDVATRRFTAVREERVERLVYWTRIGRRFPLSTAQEYAAILQSVLRGVVPDGVLVRISTIGGDIAQSDAALNDFASQMVATTSELGRKILLG